MNRRTGTLFFLLILVLISALQAVGEKPFITLSTTTSTENSGLLVYLNDAFTQQTGIEVRVVAKGSGAAMELARKGDADIIMVHSPDEELRFMEEGFGTNRYALMYNDFVLAGPEADPAAVKGPDIESALKKIADQKAVFISRGDHSGTHVKELYIWRKLGIEPTGEWYLSAGQGMSKVLTMAHEKLAYTLTDRGTYISMKGKLGLIVLVQGGEILRNPYSVIPVNPVKHPHVKTDLAQKYADWLLSKTGQKMIDDFKIDGEQLFFTYPKP